MGKAMCEQKKGLRRKEKKKTSCKEKRQLRKGGGRGKEVTYSSVEDKKQLMSCVKRNV
jgi:hypothetical protein